VEDHPRLFGFFLRKMAGQWDFDVNALDGKVFARW